MAYLDLTQFFALISGDVPGNCGMGVGYDPGFAFPGSASGLVPNANPPYTVVDFAAFYPKFLGPATSVPVTLTAGSATLAATSTTGLAAGMILASPSISPTVIQSMTADSITLSAPVTVTDTEIASVYASPLLPAFPILSFVALASAHLNSTRWREQWRWAMALYTAHLCTMYLQSEGVPGQAVAQTALMAAQRGLGILTSKSAGGVSAGYQPVTSQGAGTWALTSYGLQLWQMSRSVGMGPIYVS